MNRFYPLFSLLLFPSILLGQEPSTKAEQMLLSLGYEESITLKLENMVQRLHQTMDGYLKPEEVAVFEEQIIEVLSWEDIKPDLIARLHESFSEEELNVALDTLQTYEGQLLLATISECSAQVEIAYTEKMENVGELLKNLPENKPFIPTDIDDAIRFDIVTNGSIFDESGNQISLDELVEIVDQAIAQDHHDFIINSMKTTRVGHVMTVVDLIKSKGALSVSIATH